MRLTWSKEKEETGIGRIYCRPRGAVLKLDGAIVAKVAGTMDRGGRVMWHWYTLLSPMIPFHNSAAVGREFFEMGQAKLCCLSYVRSHVVG